MQFAHLAPAESESAVAHCDSANLKSGRARKPLHGELAFREAAFLAFCDPAPQACSKLQNLSLYQWRRLLRWLDFSGIALYFLDRLVEMQCTHWAPSEILERMTQNQADNTARTQLLIAESVSIQKRFQEKGLSYSNLKGASLWPLAVHRLELRNQLDLDYLIAEEDAFEGRRILEEMGYRFHPGHLRCWDVQSEHVWEFRRNETLEALLKDIYMPQDSFRVELHIESRRLEQRPLLDHTVSRDMFGISMPVLSPADLLIAQGLHAFKHVCSSNYRVSNLLEFHRHVVAHRNEEPFWREVRSLAEKDPMAREGLGVVLLLIKDIIGEFAPSDFTGWTVERLLPGVRFWVRANGRRSAFACLPGTKLYLLLERELYAKESGAKHSLRKMLLPLHFPAATVQSLPNQRFSIRMLRYRRYFLRIFPLLRFHAVEGVRCIWQAIWFRRRVAAYLKGQL